MNKTTFLVNAVLDDGNTILVETTSSNWHKIIDENKQKPKEDRRYFYADVIYEGSSCDCIIMEVSKELFDKWSNQERNTRRSRSESKQYQHIPLGALLSDSSLCVATSTNFESTILGTMIVADLRKALSTWQPWGIDLLDMYLAGEKSRSATLLMQKYGIPRSTAFRYKDQFESFIKKFLLG